MKVKRLTCANIGNLNYTRNTILEDFFVTSLLVTRPTSPWTNSPWTCISNRTLDARCFKAYCLKNIWLFC
ncbi:hypothetical protein H2248_008104 [Termitomyces sp. 'cryptogamus']|nr:hypothetical protein H2248_008104 [Termitomyces sp. 'cryptogamus']